jgi:rhodanese-related sulfurtransferase
VLTGDALFIGDVGRPDLLAASGAGLSADQMARQLYRSLHGKLLALPDATRVFPAHGAGSACGKHLSTETESTIGAERDHNYALAPMSEDEFVDAVLEGQPVKPHYFEFDAHRNREARPLLADDAPPPALELAAVLGLQADGASLLDAREPADFATGHLQAAINVGLQGRFAEYAGDVLAPDSPVVLVGDPATALEVKLRLARIGFDRVLGQLDDLGRVFHERPELVEPSSRLTIEQLAERRVDLSSLTLVSIGSAPLPPTLHRAVAELLPGAMVTNNYSMTEAGTAFTYLPPGELDRRPGSVGIPLPPTEIRIADEAGDALAPGETGEVLINVGDHHREYYRDPEATARTWSGPWLRSGDLGRVDEDGYLYIIGRAKDVVIRGGNNISATEVEHALYEHDAVLEAAVIAIPHDVLGEDVAAFVVPRAGRQLDADELRQFCAERLADYKVPRAIWFVDALPRNANGKVVKRELLPPAD